MGASHVVESQFPAVWRLVGNMLGDDELPQRNPHYLMKRLQDDSESILGHLPTLERRLLRLQSTRGFSRLTDVLNKPRDWNEYQEMLAQLDLTLAFLDAGVLVEIEPTIPSTMRKTDALLLVGGASVYCEMTSPRLSVSPQSAGESQDVKRVIRHLQPKVTRQLPAPSHGLLAMDTTKCGLFSHDVRVIAAAVIPHHRNLLGICLWSWEGDDDDFSFKTPTVLLSHSSTLHLGLARQVANLLKAPLELADF